MESVKLGACHSTKVFPYNGIQRVALKEA
jgi:hypothetical protein